MEPKRAADPIAVESTEIEAVEATVYPSGYSEVKATVAKLAAKPRARAAEAKTGKAEEE